MIGYAFCGSFCTLSRSLSALRALVSSGIEIQPILSEAVAQTDTRFYAAADFCKEVEELCHRRSITRIVDAEPLGPKQPLEAMILAPCTGNTLAKIANGITDSCVTMAAKAHLRCDRPLLVSLASNDSLSANLANIARLLTRKQTFFVPMHQDDPVGKPYSLVSDFRLIPDCLEAALAGKQLRPLFLA